MSASAPYTCITCHVAFINGELQRAHYKTDWHRYNLKRKVADLGPITASEFTEKVESIQQQRSEKNIDGNNKAALACKDCGKAFTSENGLLNHIKSKKHIDTVAKHANLPVSRKSKTIESYSYYIINSQKVQINIRILQQINQRNHPMKNPWKKKKLKKITAMMIGMIWMMELR